MPLRLVARDQSVSSWIFANGESGERDDGRGERASLEARLPWGGSENGRETPRLHICNVIDLHNTL